MSELIRVDGEHESQPRILRDPQERQRRKDMLVEPHIAPLAGYTDRSGASRVLHPRDCLLMARIW